MKNAVFVLVLIAFFSSIGFSQEDDGGHRRSNGPRRQLATIVFAGLGGAILGLSTLSFYGRPQDQLSNIAIGFAVGVISGTVYVTFRSATSRDYYDDRNPPVSLNEDFSRKKALTTEEPHFIYGPLLTRVTPEQNAYGGVVTFRF